MTRRRIELETLTRPLMTERQLQDAIIQAAQVLGWRVYHPWSSIHSAAGYPDLTAVHPGQKRVLWAEIKSSLGKLSPYQRAWRHDLVAAGCDYYVWVPDDWLTGKVERVLRGTDAYS